MKKAEKTKKIEEFTESLEKARAVFISDYKGLKVNDVTTLRLSLRKADTHLKVVKNRLALRAFKNLKTKDLNAIQNHVTEMTAVAMSFGDVVSGAKSLNEFAKDHEQVKLRGGWVEGKIVSLTEIKALAKLPSKKELIGKIVWILAEVPAGFVRVLSAVPAKWVYLLEAIKRQKEQKGG